MHVTEVLREKYALNGYYNCRTKGESMDSSFPLEKAGENSGSSLSESTDYAGHARRSLQGALTREGQELLSIFQKYPRMEIWKAVEAEEDADEDVSQEEEQAETFTEGNTEVDVVCEMSEGRLMTPQELRDFLRQQIDQMYEELKAGRTEPSFQIGAASYTITEWEEMLENFDEVQEEIREEIREEIAERAEHAEQSRYLVKEKSRAEKEADVLAAVSGTVDPKKTEEKAGTSVLSGEDALVSVITAEHTMAQFPMAEGDEEEGLYITVYTAEEVYCRRAGESEPIWEIPLEDGQYEEIMAFLNGGNFPEGDNLTFAASQSFWEDFLSGKLDIDGFMKFWDYRVENGIADITDETEDGLYINREAAIFGMYTNPPGLFNIIDPKDLLLSGEETVFPEGWENQWPKKIVRATGEEEYVWSWNEWLNP